IAVAVIPAVLLCFLRPRVKLNKYILLTVSSAIIIAAYIPLSGWYSNVGKNAPELDYMYNKPIYKGIKQQIVENSQFQLERDLSSGEEQYTGYGNFPIIGYTSESAAMCSEFCYQHLRLQEQDNQYNILYNTVSYDIKQTLNSLVNGGFYPWWIDRYSKFKGLADNERPVDIVILPGKPEDSYLNNNRETVEIVSVPIALDALVFIVHKDNPVDILSTEQLRDIYAGKIKNWQELGGENNKIKNYQRSRLSLTNRVMNEMIMKGTPLTKPVQVKNLSDWDEAAYQNFPESIGYCLLSFLENDGFRLDGKYKILSIDDIQPNETNIGNGTYPYVANFYAAIRKGEEEDTGGRFLEWILSDEGQACIRQAGYLPLH
ncbi:MAG: substrate-binding domain-containing protein, partial [Oscillospiraceae bacterium]|nr:substrate-binding domain-containing protein [Oscillospiraceae bacterium]